MSTVVIVTRHPGLVVYLHERGLAPADCEVIDHATVDLVRGKHVIGVLPMWLAAECELVTEIPMNIPPELRGVELTAEQTAEYAGEPKSYRVTRVVALDHYRRCGLPKEEHRLVNYADGQNVGQSALICPRSTGLFYT